MKRLFLVSALFIAFIMMLTCCGNSTFFELVGNVTDATSTAKQETTTPTTELQTTVSSLPVLDDNAIAVIAVPGDVKRGSSATLTICGRPNTLYSIKVKYSSGYSSAGGLTDTLSDEDGICSWSWRVGVNTSPDEYEIIISDDQNSYMLTFKVI